MKRSAAVLLAFALLAGACTGSDDGEPAPDGTATSVGTTPPETSGAPSSTTLPPPTTAPPGSTQPTTAPPSDEAVPASFRQPRAVAPFAPMAEVPLLGDTPAYAGPATPTSADGLLVAPAVAAGLDPGATATLLDNGFVIVPSQYAQFFQLYDIGLYEDLPLFVTTDVAFHVWHQAFSKVLREAEQQALLPVLEDLVSGLSGAAAAQRTELAGTPLAESAARVEQWFEAVADLLEITPAVSPLARDEVELARAAAEMTESPITSFGVCNILESPSGCVDYTLYRPRGHYTRNADLERYFRAMSALGQAGFFVTETPSLRLGILAAAVLTTDPALTEAWGLVYEPTAFLVGLADDYTPFELADVVADLVPGGFDDLAVFADDALVDEIGRELLVRRDVGINPEAAAVRVMGARFVVDSFILDQLAWPNVGEPPPELRRVQVSPLDVAAAFGSEFAYDIQDAAGETAYLHYDDQLDLMQELIAARSIDDWAATVYDAWLYALAPMWSPRGAAFPDFMQRPAWTAKAHQTGFGSYTELKHDTILYAKQGFAAQGGGEPPSFQPRHWVEPDPVVYARLAAAAGLLQDGLGSRGLLPAELDDLLDTIGGFLDRLERIARDELAGRPISAEDNDWLEVIGPVLESIWVESSDIELETGEPSAADQEAALVADIFRSTFAVLELGTGYIDEIYVLVPNDEGRFQVALGGVYSYYEFWQPAEEGRLTDEEWRALLAAGDAPDRPGWNDAFLPGGGAAELPRQELFFGAARGLFCRDLAAAGFDYGMAYEYWVWDGEPDRMDADRNGVPCETVYPPDEVAAYLGG